MRAAGSQMWWSWNPRRKKDPVDVMLRGPEIPTGAIVVRANWRDNPWFTPELKQERIDCLRMTPDQYDHVWNGDYVSVVAGAYYARHIAEARAANQMCRLNRDKMFRLRVYADIGGTGARADAAAWVVCQFVAREIRVLAYCEGQGQELSYYVQWLTANGFTPDCTDIHLPHDGAQGDKVFATSYERALREAGYHVRVIPNQGKGAAMKRVEAARRLFPQIYFNEAQCAGLLEALGWYHEKQDEKREIGLGPEHDWSSHGADAFGLMCSAYEPPRSVLSQTVTVPNFGAV
jgi:phage terminase large subunit